MAKVLWRAAENLSTLRKIVYELSLLLIVVSYTFIPRIETIYLLYPLNNRFWPLRKRTTPSSLALTKFTQQARDVVLLLGPALV